MVKEQFEKQFQVRGSEVDMWRRLRITALLEYLQDAATEHAAGLEVGVAELAARNLAWVVSRYRVKITGTAARGELVRVVTWPVSRDAYLSSRHFEVFVGSVPIAVATSTWAAVDLTTRRSVRLPDRIPEFPLLPRPVMREESPPLPRLTTAENEWPFRVQVYNLDVNQHVGNAAYAGWALETVPMRVAQTCRLTEIEITYRSEAVYGDTITARSKQSEEYPPTFLHQIVNRQTGKELARLRTRWCEEIQAPVPQTICECG